MKRTATSGVGKARGTALSLLARLDPVIENLLRKDEPTLAAWRSARHVDRRTQRRKAAAESTAAATDPASDSHAA